MCVRVWGPALVPQERRKEGGREGRGKERRDRRRRDDGGEKETVQDGSSNN